MLVFSALRMWTEEDGAGRLTQRLVSPQGKLGVPGLPGYPGRQGPKVIYGHVRCSDTPSGPLPALPPARSPFLGRLLRAPVPCKCCHMHSLWP